MSRQTSVAAAAAAAAPAPGNRTRESAKEKEKEKEQLLLVARHFAASRRRCTWIRQQRSSESVELRVSYRRTTAPAHWRRTIAAVPFQRVGLMESLLLLLLVGDQLASGRKSLQAAKVA